MEPFTPPPPATPEPAPPSAPVPETLPSPPPAPLPEPPLSEPPDGRRRLLVIGGGVLVVVIIAVVAILLLSRPHKGTGTASTAGTTGTPISNQSLDPTVFKNFLESNSLTQTQPTTLVVGANTTFTGTTNLQGPTTFSGSLTLQNSLNVAAELNVVGAASFQGSVVTEQSLSVHGNLQVLGSLGVNTLSIASATISNQLNLDGHLATGGSVPTVQAGAGSGSAHATITGNDTAGTVIITTGNAPPATGTLATITFAHPFTIVPHILLTPIGLDAGHVQWYATRTASFFTIESDGSTPAGRVLSFDYLVVQ